MNSDRPLRDLQGHGLLILGPSHIEPVDYWLGDRRDERGQVATSGWIAARFPVLEALWRDQRVVTLVLHDGRTLQLQLTSELGACIVVESPE